MKAATFRILSLLVFGLMVTNQMSAQENKPCVPDYDISSIKDVIIDENAKHVSNETEIVVDRPVDKFYKWWFSRPLEKILSGVSCTRIINDKKYWKNGSRRLIYRHDGNTLVEEVIENIPEKYFAYKVWNFSAPFLAERVEYAKGEFWYTPMGNKTHLRWRYSFKLSNEVYREEFESFSRHIWNSWMISTLNRMKKLAEEAIR